MIKTFSAELKAAASKECVSGENKNTQSFVTTIVDSSLATFTASSEVIPTKMDYEILPQGGSSYAFVDKKHLRADYERKIRNIKKHDSRITKSERAKLRAALKKCSKDIKPESALMFQSEFLTTAFGAKNIVFFGSFLTALATSTNWKNTVAVTSMYLSQVLSKDLVDVVIDQIVEFRIKPEGSDDDSVWQKAKNVTGVFSKFRSTPLYNRLRDIVSLCVISGIVDPKAGNVTAKSLELFNVKVAQKLSLGDLWDTVTRTIIYFAESGYRIFTTGNVSFLFEPEDVLESYRKVVEFWPMCKTGNLMRLQNMDSRDFGVLLDATTKKVKSAIAENRGPEKNFYMSMLRHLVNIRSEYLQCKTDGKLRQAPLMVAIIGESSVGKSTISNMLAVTLLKAMDRPSEAAHIRSYNPTDKYDSWADGLTECLICDDLGAMSPEYSDVNPVDMLIRLKNNAPTTATKADVEEKGKIPIDVSLIICTMNSMRNLTVGAACKEAILRRFDFCVKPIVKPEFRDYESVNVLSPTKVIKKYGTMAGVLNVWDFQIIEGYLSNKGESAHANYQAELVDFNGDRDMEHTSNQFNWERVTTLDTPQMLSYAIKKAREHKKVQGFVVENNNALNSVIHVCNKCDNVKEFCECVNPEFGISFSWIDATKAFDGALGLVCNVPRRMADVPIANRVMDLIFARRLIGFYKRQVPLYAMYWCTFIAFAIEIVRRWNHPVTIALLFAAFYYCFICFATIVRRARDKAYDEILSCNVDTSAFIRYIYRCRVWAAGVVCAAAYGIYKFYEVFKSNAITTEGNLDPTTKEDVDERLSDVNPWADFEITAPPVTLRSTTSTYDQLSKFILKNLVFFEYEEAGSRRYCDAFFLKSNFVLIPRHMLPKDVNVKATFVRGKNNYVNSYFKSFCGFRDAYIFPNTDLALVQVHNAPSFADVTDLFPVDIDPMERVVTEFHRDSDGEIICDTYRVQHAQVSNNSLGYNKPIFLGSRHETTKTTFNGRCMSVLLCNAKFPYIHGFHLGGNGGTKAVSGSLLRDEIVTAYSEIHKFLPSAAAGDFPTSINNIDILREGTIHSRSPVRYLPAGQPNTVEAYGTTIGATTPRSNVEPTIISDAVAEICGYENRWDKPPFNSIRDHSVALATAANNCDGFRPESLEWAIDDYVTPLIKRFKELELDIRPLTRMEAINGVPGRRFIDKIVRKTSIGFPRSGKKNMYFKKLEANDIWSDPVDMDDETYAEVDRMLACYRRGERSYTPSKTSLKDEPTKIGKNKCRIFYVTNVALQYLVRKYFLAICAAYSTCPLLSNCAVGINRQGPEWEQLVEFIRANGDDRILAGDYSKFDLHMPCQIVRAAFACHLRIAEAFGYSDDDLLIMNGIAADLSNPIIGWNGTLLQLGSLHLSGNNLTVYNGSIANNLYLRCHYYEQCDHRVPFRDVVNVVTYGDDVIGSVSSKLSNFNHITFRDFLADHGMTFTMPDKESVATEFMNIDNTDFLKCVNRFDEDIGHNVAKLSEDSIFKSLHRILHSSELSREEAAGMNIDGALREWFFHGRNVYNLRRRQMQEVARRCDIVDFCKELDVSFDKRVEKWNEMYFPDIKPEGGSSKLAFIVNWADRVRQIPRPMSQGMIVDPLYKYAKETIPYTLIDNDMPILSQIIGEVDCLFHTNVNNKNVFIIVEIKHSHSASQRRKGRRQLMRQVTGLSVISPNNIFIGALLTFDGYEEVIVSPSDEEIDQLMLPWRLKELTADDDESESLVYSDDDDLSIDMNAVRKFLNEPE